MALAFVNHVKARTRNIQLDGGTHQPLAPISVSSNGELHPQPAKRTSSLGLGLDNGAALTLDSLCPIRRYRSLLEVEDPPAIQAVEPLTYDELYPHKLDSEVTRIAKPKRESNDSHHLEQPLETGQNEENTQNGSC